MTATRVSFIDSESTILMIAIVVLIARLVPFFTMLNPRFKFTNANQLFFSRQPYLIAILLIASYLVNNHIGFISINSIELINPLKDSGDVINYLVSLLRVGLVLWLITKEEGLIFLWLENNNMIGFNLKNIMLSIRTSLQVAILAVLLPFILPRLELLPQLEILIDITIKLLIIWSLAWVANQSIHAFERSYINNNNGLKLTDYHQRSLVTRTKIFRKISVIAIIILAFAASCLYFESARAIGTSILASAGILTGVLGLAANKIIGNYLVGLQIAITQPIRLNDAITVEGDYGIVEDISLNYVVIKIWDLRRLILPINYFIDKPFHNYSRNSTDIISQIVFYADYTLPVDRLRDFFYAQVRASNYWDGNTLNLQVTDVESNIIRLRGIASTRNPGDSWNLKCEVLEKIIAFIAKEYPDSLPKVRNQYFCITDS